MSRRDRSPHHSPQPPPHRITDGSTADLDPIVIHANQRPTGMQIDGAEVDPSDPAALQKAGVRLVVTPAPFWNGIRRAWFVRGGDGLPVLADPQPSAPNVVDQAYVNRLAANLGIPPFPPSVKVSA